jgi:hypothetical protein
MNSGRMKAEWGKIEMPGQKILCVTFFRQKTKIGRAIESGSSYASFIFMSSEQL